MNTPIGKANELPIHFKECSNEKALIKYENYDDYMCFLHKSLEDCGESVSFAIKKANSYMSL